MDIKDLKATWNKYSTQDLKRRQMNSDELGQILHTQTKTLIERLKQNIWIGFSGLSFLCILIVADDFILSPILEKQIPVPVWIKVIDIISAILFMGTILYFINKYKKSTRSFSQTNNLQKVIDDLIDLLNQYQKLFHTALLTFMGVIGINYLAGLFRGLQFAAASKGITILELNHLQMFEQLLYGIIFLFCLSLIILFGFKWAFKRLYGRYLKQLTIIKNELTEI